MSSPNQTHRNHYVPQWYQRRFLEKGDSHFYYLDLTPETKISDGGTKYRRRALLKWGPKKCFCHEDLYTLKLASWSTDQIEKSFFGPIDAHGEKAVEFFSNFSMREGVHEAFGALLPYMDAQRLRTPRGLDWLKRVADIRNHTLTLLVMRRIFQRHATMWTEGVWEIVNATQSPTKFLLTDTPVTFFNVGAFPNSKYCRYPNDVELGAVGTRTLFPLGLESCLLITHVQLVRNPWESPLQSRTNARGYDPTTADLSYIQFGRELEEDEVLRINIILKRRAARYIAATEKEWLYPEIKASTSHWSNLDDDWFLLPHLYKVPFSGGMIVGYKGGGSWARDEYGRKPTDPNYQDKRMRDREWARHLRAQIAWALKRRGKSVAHVDKFRHDEVEDKIMADQLKQFDAEREHRSRTRRRRDPEI